MCVPLFQTGTVRALREPLAVLAHFTSLGRFAPHANRTAIGVPIRRREAVFFRDVANNSRRPRWPTTGSTDRSWCRISSGIARQPRLASPPGSRVGGVPAFPSDEIFAYRVGLAQLQYFLGDLASKRSAGAVAWPGLRRGSTRS